jgi:hypothetical protein
MPNGTTDHCFIRRQDLAELIDGLGEDRIIGETMARDGESFRFDEITGSALKVIVQNFDPDANRAPTHGDDVLVTEQDHDDYVLHLQPWVIIAKKSPLFVGIEGLNVDWKRRVFEKLRRS